jgi:hypothetical protein
MMRATMTVPTASVLILTFLVPMGNAGEMRVTSSWENFELSQPTVDVIEDATNDLGDRMESSSATEECEENIEDEMDDHGVDTLKHYPIIGAAVNIAEHADDIPVCASALPAPAVLPCAGMRTVPPAKV